jgi:sulfite reductase beta subunit-like hemoprotein
MPWRPLILPKIPPEEAAKVRAALAYYRLDTLAMVKILEKLREGCS